MYLWVALDAQELDAVRDYALQANARIGLNEIAFTLPQHVSLKISFEVADVDFSRAVAELTGLFSRQQPFVVEVRGLECVRGILWIRMRDSEELVRLHEELDRWAWESMGAPQHAFDKDFHFHSTLFMDENAEKLRAMEACMQKAPIPLRFEARRFLIGCSETGKAGEYRVVKRVDASR